MHGSYIAGSGSVAEMEAVSGWSFS